MQYGMLEPKEIDALITEAWGEGADVYSYSLEITAPTGFEIQPDMYFFLGTLLRYYGDARAAAERERIAAFCEVRARALSDTRIGTPHSGEDAVALFDVAHSIRALDTPKPSAS